MRASRFAFVLLSLLGLLLTSCSRPLPPPLADLDSALWHDYRAAFITDTGRVIDVSNGGVSHTEGQGYGMLLAVAADDRATFERLWNWTRTHLSRPDDPFFSFRWDEASTPPIADFNNASDGEVLIAWALARADQRWHVDAYRKEAIVLARAIRAQLLRQSAIGTVLLPGMEGFEHPAHITVNPSYWVFPAFLALDRIDPSPQWKALNASGRKLLSKARFGEAGLPPDWVNITANGKLELGRAEYSRFSFDAVRIPLYSCWAGVENRPLLEAIATQWSDPKLPAWINLKTGQSAPYSLSPTQNVMNRILLNCLGRESASPTESAPLVIQDDYYASTLALLGELAMKER